MATPSRDAVMRLVREKITDGTLRPGTPAPSGVQLARETGRDVHACRAALRALVAEGTLAAPASDTARPRVPLESGPQRDLESLRLALAAELAAGRRAAGMTQPELAAKLGVSLTAVGHAETGRTWHGREFWRRAQELLGGDLLGLYGSYKATEAGAVPPPAPPAPPVARAATVITVEVPSTVGAVTVRWHDGTETTVRPGGAGV